MNTQQTPVDMVLYCPKCGTQHIDAPDERTPDWTNPPHKSHLCHGCGHIWRPSDTPTNGVERTTSGKDADTAPLPQQESQLLVAAEKATPLLEAARAVVNSSVHPSSCQGGYYRVPENVWQKLYTAVIQNLQDEVITSDDPIVKIGVLYMKAGSPPLSGTEFLAWCAKYFGPDSDEKYLAEAVSDLLTKEKFSAAIAASKGSASSAASNGKLPTYNYRCKHCGRLIHKTGHAPMCPATL